MLRTAIVGILITGITVAAAASLPIIEIPTGSDQELRVMPPTAYPFTMQQYRDYNTDQFYYRIVLGWPDGIPLYQGATMDDQSEYIHLAHLGAGVLLGLYMTAGLCVLLILAYLVGYEMLKKQS